MKIILKKTIHTEVIWIRSMLPEANSEYGSDNYEMLFAKFRKLFTKIGTKLFNEYCKTLEDIYMDD